VLNSNGQYQYQRLTASGLIKNGSGLLGGFIVASGSGSVTLYDNTTGAGTLILNTMVIADATPYPLPVLFTVGCYAVISGTVDITFFYN
jgi:hypothetical protein